MTIPVTPSVPIATAKASRFVVTPTLYEPSSWEDVVVNPVIDKTVLFITPWLVDAIPINSPFAPDG